MTSRVADTNGSAITTLTVISGEAVDDGHVLPESPLVVLRHQGRLHLTHGAQPSQLRAGEEQVMRRHLTRHPETLHRGEQGRG